MKSLREHLWYRNRLNEQSQKRTSTKKTIKVIKNHQPVFDGVAVFRFSCVCVCLFCIRILSWSLFCSALCLKNHLRVSDICSSQHFLIRNEKWTQKTSLWMKEPPKWAPVIKITSKNILIPSASSSLRYSSLKKRSHSINIHEKFNKFLHNRSKNQSEMNSRNVEIRNKWSVSSALVIKFGARKNQSQPFFDIFY